MVFPQRVLGMAFLFLAAGCTSSSTGASALAGASGDPFKDSGAAPTPVDSGSSTSGNGADGGIGSDSSSGGNAERTLASCTTDISADAPEFFKRFFRCVKITTSTMGVVIETSDLPPHRSFYYGAGHANFEPFDTSRGGQYRPNPNKIGAQKVVYTVPNAPVSRGLTIDASMVDGVVRTSTRELPMGPAGVAIDSVILFNPMAAPGDDIEKEKYTFDNYNAHPAGTTYHYHTVSKGPLEVLKSAGLIADPTPGSARIELYGIMCDGTVVAGCNELDESPPDVGSLDAQGGHVHTIKDKAGATLLADRYHVHVCPSQAGRRKYTPEIQFYSTCTK